MTKQLKVTNNTTLAEILKMPGAEKVLAKYNLPCLNCAFASLESEELKIGKICEMYEIDLKSLLEDLNKMGKRK